MSDNFKVSVPLNSLLSDNFIKNHTKFSSFEEFLNNGNYSMNSKEDLNAINETEFNKYISDNSDFSSWTEMYTTAGNEFIAAAIQGKI